MGVPAWSDEMIVGCAKDVYPFKRRIGGCLHYKSDIKDCNCSCGCGGTK